MGSARVSIVQAAAKLIHDSPALTFWSRLENKWSAMQVGRQGSYSIERLESLDHYCKTTSRVRVILVCVLTPLPAFTVAVLLECLPLQHPSEGWAANWVFWIRWTLTLLAISFVGVSQLLTYVPGLDFTLLKRWIVSVGSTSVFVGTCILAAVAKGFPVPFMLQLGSVIMGLYIAAMVRLVFSKKEFGNDSPDRPYFRRFYRFLLAFVVLGGVYPIYRVIYDAAPLDIRGVMILALPLWKFTAKKLMVSAILELEDFIPELVAFTVDFFSALFVSACMTTSGSTILSIMFIVSDVAQGLLEFHEVRVNAKVIMDILHRDQKSERTNSFEATDLIAMILRVARNPRGFRVTCIENVRLRACLPHLLAEEQERELQILQASGIYGSTTCSAPTSSASCKRSIIRWLPPQFSTNASIFPENTAVSRTASKDYSVKSKRVETAQKLVEQGLQLLFHCEYLALVEYVECIVPLVFVSYKSVLEQLPNAVYYPGGTGSWGVVAVVNLLVFSALEIATFVLFIRFLQRKFAFSPLFQLAFVLETQVYLVQAKLLIEVVTLLQSRLAHFGGGYAANIEHKS